MCVATPTRILSRDGDRALVDKDGLRLEVDVSLLPEAKPGDFIIVHVGIGLSVLNPDEAKEIHAAQTVYWSGHDE
jgi:hydrogenase expression/formation protein HypC